MAALLTGWAAACNPTAGQEGAGARWTLGIETQAYPAGLTAAAGPGLVVGSRHDLRLHGGYNATDRRDFGEHDDEQGGGPGIGASWHYRPRGEGSGWFVGLRTDLWWLSIDWTDTAPNVAGTTDITVFQPTARLGYAWVVGGGAWAVEASAALGVEINVRTRGSPVGEGAIALLGLGVSHRLGRRPDP